MKQFPIHSASRREFPDLPNSVSWRVVEAHNDQAMKNHSQTLERLAERGGLSPAELYYVVNNREWPQGSFHAVDESVFVDWLLLYLQVNDHFDHEEDCKCFECWNFKEGSE